MSSYEDQRYLRIQMENFAKWRVDYRVLDKLPDESWDRFYEKMTILICKEYSPTRNYGIKKAEVKEMFIDILIRLNKGFQVDLRKDNYYVYKTFPDNYRLVYARTKKAAKETAQLASIGDSPSNMQSFQRIALIKDDHVVTEKGDKFELNPFLHTINIVETEVPSVFDK